MCFVRILIVIVEYRLYNTHHDKLIVTQDPRRSTIWTGTDWNVTRATSKTETQGVSQYVLYIYTPSPFTIDYSSIFRQNGL